MTKAASDFTYGCRFSLCFITLILCCHFCQSKKIRYATDKDCDRYSLDAVYHEKYKPITNNIFADLKEFVIRVSDLTADSLTTMMAELPDRDSSGNEEKRVYVQFKAAKDVFSTKMKKIQRNITSTWEELVTSNFDLLFDNGKSSLEDYLNKTVRMTESYSSARSALDSILSTFVEFIKGTVQNGLTGIKAASEDAIKKEEKDKNNTEESKKDSSKTDISVEDRMREKMVEITKMIVPGFLGNVSVQMIERKMDPGRRSGIDPENRDSVLDDILFDMLMVKNRMKAIIQSDIPRDKGATDLARRSIYTYWGEMADNMYKEKLRAKKSPEDSKSGRLYYRNLWQDEEQLMDTLLNLMEIYP